MLVVAFCLDGIIKPTAEALTLFARLIFGLGINLLKKGETIITV